LKKAKGIENENYNYMARVQELENENNKYMTRVKQLEKEADEHMELINYLEKENDISMAREKFYIIGLLLSWLLMLLIDSIALIK
jgi:hypothetical protein